MLRSVGLRKPTIVPVPSLFEPWVDAFTPVAPAALPARALLLEAISSDFLWFDITRGVACELCRRGQRQELLSACQQDASSRATRSVCRVMQITRWDCCS